MTTLSLSNRGRLSGPTTAVLAFFFSLLPLSFLPLATGEVGGGLRPSPVATSLQSQRRLQQRALSAAGARRDGGTGQDLHLHQLPRFPPTKTPPSPPPSPAAATPTPSGVTSHEHISPGPTPQAHSPPPPPLPTVALWLPPMPADSPPLLQSRRHSPGFIRQASTALRLHSPGGCNEAAALFAKIGVHPRRLPRPPLHRPRSGEGGRSTASAPSRRGGGADACGPPAPHASGLFLIDSCVISLARFPPAMGPSSHSETGPLEVECVTLRAAGHGEGTRKGKKPTLFWEKAHSREPYPLCIHSISVRGISLKGHRKPRRDSGELHNGKMAHGVCPRSVSGDHSWVAIRQ